MEIIDGPGNCQYSLDINRIAAPLTSMLWPSANQPLAGEASVCNDNVGTKGKVGGGGEVKLKNLENG